MNLTDLQKRTAHAIVNIFETGRPEGDYGQVTLLPGDPGQLTYGRSQATLASGNLFLLIKAYCEAKNSHFGSRLRLYLPNLALRDPELNNDLRFKNLLRNAGDDPVMHAVQDNFFNRIFWEPSIAEARKLNFVTALGATIIYDSIIHGSWNRIRRRTASMFDESQQPDEKRWLLLYVNERSRWLANHSIPILRRTIYRMQELRALINQQKWDLELPLVVRGITIHEDILITDLDQPIRASAMDTEQRLLYLTFPFMRGEDVKAVQTTLFNQNHTIKIDAIFGPKTERAVKQFQANHKLKIDGIVGSATRAALGFE